MWDSMNEEDRTDIMDNLGITGETLCLSITCEKYTTVSSRQHMVTTPVHLPSLHVVLFDI
jgi:hypothetical protein